MVTRPWEPTEAEVEAARQADGCDAYTDHGHEGDQCPECVAETLRKAGPMIAARALREAAAVCESDAKGPITGDGIVGPLHLLGIAQGLKFAASILRSRAAELETPQEKPDA